MKVLLLGAGGLGGGVGALELALEGAQGHVGGDAGEQLLEVEGLGT